MGLEYFEHTRNTRVLVVDTLPTGAQICPRVADKFSRRRAQKNRARHAIQDELVEVDVLVPAPEVLLLLASVVLDALAGELAVTLGRHDEDVAERLHQGLQRRLLIHEVLAVAEHLIHAHGLRCRVERRVEHMRGCSSGVPGRVTGAMGLQRSAWHFYLVAPFRVIIVDLLDHAVLPLAALVQDLPLALRLADEVSEVGLELGRRVALAELEVLELTWLQQRPESEAALCHLGRARHRLHAAALDAHRVDVERQPGVPSARRPVDLDRHLCRGRADG